MKKNVCFAIIAMAVMIAGSTSAQNLNNKTVVMGDNTIEVLAKNIKKYSNLGKFSSGLAHVSKNGKYGFIDKSGKEVIPCIYTSCTDFREGLSRVEKNGKMGFIDRNGTVVVPIIYEYASLFYDGLAYVSNNRKKYGYIDKSGNTVIPFIYDRAHVFSDGKACVGRNKNYYLIDKSGKETLLNNIYLNSFSEGLAAAYNRQFASGYIDKSGRIVIPFEYHFTFNFCEGYGRVEKNSNYGFINKRGKVVVPLIYFSAEDFSEGLAAVQKHINDDFLWGFVDGTGKVVIPFKYESQGALKFSEGLAGVGQNSKYGYINKRNEVVIPFVYDRAEDFHEGLAVVKRDDSSGYVDKHGRCTLDYTGSESSNSLDEEDNYVYDEADVMPQFPGGQEALGRYISSNVRYPKMAFENGVDGKVVVAFVVERDGSITGANAVVKADPLLNKEAIRVIMNMPRWKPGIQNGKPIRVKTTVPVVFRIRKPWE